MTPAGMTAVEMMVVLAVIGILLAAGVPAFGDLIQRYRLGTTASELFAAVNLARSEAIQRGTRVDLVPAGTGDDWTQGWVVMIDRNGNQRRDPEDAVIFSHGPVAGGIRISASFTDSRKQYVAYTASGQTRTNASSQSRQLGSWTLTSKTHTRRIVISFLGRPRLCDPAMDPSTC